MIIVGLDVAATTGFSVFDGSSIRAGEFKAKGDTDGAIFRSFEDQLRGMLIDARCTHLAMEEPLRSDLTKTTVVGVGQSNAFGGMPMKAKTPITTVSTMRRLYGLAAIVQKIAHDLAIPMDEVNQKSWRSCFLGPVSPPKGCKDRTGWWKDQSLAKARSMGLDIKSKDAADAVGVGYYLHLKLNGSAFGDDLFANGGNNAHR